jgi:hypothetical protein
MRAPGADARRARVADQRDARPRERRDDLAGARGPLCACPATARRDAKVREEGRGDARVLGTDAVDAGQDVDRVQRHVAQVPERRRDHI